jgi:hypothetical protein
VLQVQLMQQIEQELPYFNCSSTGTAAEDATAGSGASAAVAVQSAPELLATVVQRCKVARKGYKKLWGECRLRRSLFLLLPGVKCGCSTKYWVPSLQLC